MNIIFVGKLKDEYSMAALSMINILNNSFILPMSFGFSGVLETLVTQAYGRQSFYECGQNLKKCMLLCSLAYAPLMLSFTVYPGSAAILQFLGQDVVASEKAD